MSAQTDRWRHRARCLTAPDDEAAVLRDAEDWTPDVQRLAGRFCGSCSVVAECLASAIEHRDWGVRGGQVLRAGKRVLRSGAGPAGPQRHTDADVAAWLAEELRDGPQAAEDVRGAARDTPGVAIAAVERAREALGIVLRVRGGTGARIIIWSLPGHEDARREDIRSWLTDQLADHRPHRRTELINATPPELDATATDLDTAATALGVVVGRGKQGATLWTMPEPVSRPCRGQRRQPRRLPRSRRRRAKTAA